MYTFQQKKHNRASLNRVPTGSGNLEKMGEIKFVFQGLEGREFMPQETPVLNRWDKVANKVLAAIVCRQFYIVIL
jgi:hypothetical protein